MLIGVKTATLSSYPPEVRCGATSGLQRTCSNLIFPYHTWMIPHDLLWFSPDSIQWSLNSRLGFSLPSSSAGRIILEGGCFVVRRQALPTSLCSTCALFSCGSELTTCNYPKVGQVNIELNAIWSESDSLLDWFARRWVCVLLTVVGQTKLSVA